LVKNQITNSKNQVTRFTDGIVISQSFQEVRTGEFDGKAFGLKMPQLTTVNEDILKFE